MTVRRRTISGRYIYPFFVSSEIVAQKEVAGAFEHRLSIQNATILPHLAELKSVVASQHTEYVCSESDKLSWIAKMVCRGRIPAEVVRVLRVAVLPTSPAVQTISMRCRRETWVTWEDRPITPAIEVRFRI
jgi:hypothetical protein